MRRHVVTTPQLFVLAGTRVALGLGAGLLLSSWIEPKRRQQAGWALLLAGALSTLPIGLHLFEPAPRIIRHDLAA
jgi:hypothetical protein